jgi:hypothetical protein
LGEFNDMDFLISRAHGNVCGYFLAKAVEELKIEIGDDENNECF